MFGLIKKKNSTIASISGEHIPNNIVLQVLIFLLVFIIAEIFASIPASIPIITNVFKQIDYLMRVYNEQGASAYMQAIQSVTYTKQVIILTLYGTLLATIIVMLFCILIERRPLSTMGFHKENALKEYLLGCVLGTVLMSVIVILSTLFGGLSISLNGTIDYKTLLIYLGGFLLQGASEEVIFRGYLMNTIACKDRVLLAVVINSVLFAFAHSLNSGLTVLAVVNLFLYGAFASVYALKKDSLWGVCGIHSLWNFAQGNIWGVQVSGIDTSTSICTATQTSNINILNGGAFGLEGSVFTTIVLIVAIIIVFLFENFKKSTQKVENKNTAS